MLKKKSKWRGESRGRGKEIKVGHSNLRQAESSSERKRWSVREAEANIQCDEAKRGGAEEE